MASLSISSSRVRIGMRVACSACLAHARRRGSGACGPARAASIRSSQCTRDGRGRRPGVTGGELPQLRSPGLGFRPGRGRFGGRYVKLGSHSARSMSSGGFGMHLRATGHWRVCVFSCKSSQVKLYALKSWLTSVSIDKTSFVPGLLRSPTEWGRARRASRNFLEGPLMREAIA